MQNSMEDDWTRSQVSQEWLNTWKIEKYKWVMENRILGVI